MFVRGARNPTEADLLARARRLLPAGVRGATLAPATALVVREARGARLTDQSGNAYVDYLLGSGAILLGHAHPAVTAAVGGQLEHGTSFLLANEPAIRLAEAITKVVPCAEQVSFHCSGSEATLFAMRLARAHRRRERILKFEGGFHGMSDYALVANQWTQTPHAVPSAVTNSAGIPHAVADTMLVAPFNDAAATAALIERHHDEIAGVIVEPLQRTIPPAPGFLRALRDVTAHYGVVLIFDEVVTGFRLACGGAQTYYGVVPDLCALGKSISAGIPFGAVCGRAEIMTAADPARLTRGDYVAMTGTYGGNALAAAAALAVLEELGREGVYERLFTTGRRLMDGLERLFAAAAIPARVTGEPPVFEVWFTDREIVDFRSTLAADRARQTRFAELLLERGVLKGHEKFFVSPAHGDAEVEATLAAFESSIEALSRTS
jgi:glutamate-1-semialdehyde 2,1-aminomutase